MGRLALLALAVACAAGCGSDVRAGQPTESTPTTASTVSRAVAAHATGCTAGLRPLGSTRRAYVAVAPQGAVARLRPGGAVVARFGERNVNGYPTVFGVLGSVVDRSCKARWYRVLLPVKPNGSTGFVRARGLELQTVRTRILIDVSARRLTLLEAGRRSLVATVAVGAPATPTPTGRYYVNQRLVPTDPSGPFGPGAVGISAFSNVLTGWAQGGPVAIHGTNEPWSIGHAASNGCIRLPNGTLKKLFAAAVAGTPVIIKA